MWNVEIMLSLDQKHIEIFLKSIFICLVVVFLQLISFDVVAAGRLETIANGIVSGSSEKIQHLQMTAVYASAALLLLVLLNMVREKKKGKRLMALLAIQLLVNAVLMYHFS